MSIDNKWFMTVLNAFRCSITISPSLILKRYNFFLRNNLFTSDFNWYKLSSLSHSFFTVSSHDTFNSTKYERQSRILLQAFLSSFCQSFFDVPFGVVLGSTKIHFSLSTKRYSILSFYNSKLCLLNFSISILDVFDILILDNLLHWYQLLEIDRSCLQVQV